MLVVRFTSDTTAERLGDAWSVKFVLVLFETAATFIRLMPFFVADVAGSFEVHVLTFLDLTFVPLGSLLPL